MADSPFWHYHARFDAVEVLQRYAVLQEDLQPVAGKVTNFLGVTIDPVILPQVLEEKAGSVEPPPIPANWHADLAEWGSALRAVDLSSETFTMIELGCGWGCWMNNMGTAARLTGRKLHVIGIEGDAVHVEFCKATLAENGFTPEESTLIRGIAAGTAGTALFPIQGKEGGWGSAPVFGASPEQIEDAVSNGTYDVLDMVPISEVAAQHDIIDLLHIDIQGGEADLIDRSIETIADKVRYIVIGTHSRQIEGRLFDTLLNAGWILDIERPAFLGLEGPAPYVTVDGVQGWLNPRLS